MDLVQQSLNSIILSTYRDIHVYFSDGTESALDWSHANGNRLPSRAYWTSPILQQTIAPLKCKNHGLRAIYLKCRGGRDALEIETT